MRTRDDKIRFTVEGFGEFPLDMLRYDHCYPDSQADVVAMLWTPGCGKRSIVLEGDRCTVARWASFGWKVVS